MPPLIHRYKSGLNKIMKEIISARSDETSQLTENDVTIFERELV